MEANIYSFSSKVNTNNSSPWPLPTRRRIKTKKSSLLLHTRETGVLPLSSSSVSTDVILALLLTRFPVIFAFSIQKNICDCGMNGELSSLGTLFVSCSLVTGRKLQYSWLSNFVLMRGDIRGRGLCFGEGSRGQMIHEHSLFPPHLLQQ